MRLTLLLLLLASPAFACCPIDADSLLDEAESETLLDLLAGRVERPPATYWDAQIAAVQAEAMNPVSRGIGIAAAIAGSGNHAEALRRLQAIAAAGNRTAELQGLRVRVAMTLWWKPDTGTFSSDDCLAIAEEATAGLPTAALWHHLLSWARSTAVADAAAFLPDFFNLRYSTNKSADKDTGDLARLGLAHAEEFLIDLIRADALWENADTFHALNLVYICSGRQNLAHYARRRVWEIHEAGMHSRVTGAAAIKDIRPMTVLRQPRGGVLTTVKVISDEAMGHINTQYEARRAYALKWLEARGQYAATRAQQGRNPTSPDFWTGFVPPPYTVPPLEIAATPAAAAETAPGPQAEAEVQPSNNKTWLLLGALAAALVAGAVVKCRVGAPPAEAAK